MSVFSIEHVYKDFGKDKNLTHVLSDINVSLPDSGLVSIVGKSGSGKSTLLNILMGIEKPTKGRVLFNQKDIAKFNDKKFSEYHLSGVSIIFQHYNLFSELNVLENVAMPLLMKGASKNTANKKAMALLEKLGISSLDSRRINNLSGGEKQRVAIARSLITNPKAIFCDEPTGALDYQNSHEIMKILKEISENTLVVMVSHNREIVNRYSDQILTLKNGKIVSNISSIKKRFSNKYSKDKYKYSDKWTGKFFRKHIKKNTRKNIFSIIACSISFMAMFLSIGFTSGSKASQEQALEKNLSLCFSTVSESEFIELKDSPISYEKTLRPTLEEIDESFNEFKTLRVEENLAYLISNFASVSYDGYLINNFQMVPLFDGSLESFGKDLLVSGEACNNEFCDLIVNKEFANLLKEENVIKKELIISSSAPVMYKTLDKNNPFVKDSCNYTMRFRIVGVVEEFSFLNTPKIYYSYEGAKQFLKNERMENLSSYLNKPISYFDYLEKCEKDDPVCSYSYYLFLSDKTESRQFFNKIKEYKNNNNRIQVSSNAYEVKETYSTFIDSFSSTLIVFVIIAFLGVNFILGMISLSTFIENKKSTAIMTCLGAKNSSIYNLFLSENYIVIIFSFIIAICLSPLLQLGLNKIISKSFYFDNLISIPFSTYLGIPFGLFIILFLISTICSTIFCLVPMSIYRHSSITDELRDE